METKNGFNQTKDENDSRKSIESSFMALNNLCARSERLESNIYEFLPSNNIRIDSVKLTELTDRLSAQNQTDNRSIKSRKKQHSIIVTNKASKHIIQH